ncbi:hypothetical protein J6590_106894, partial [Homalodisca vitripennis]
GQNSHHFYCSRDIGNKTVVTVSKQRNNNSLPKLNHCYCSRYIGNETERYRSLSNASMAAGQDSQNPQMPDLVNS